MTKEPQENINRELSEAGSTLSSDRYRDGFTVPDDYFDTLPLRIQDKIAGRKPIFYHVTALAIRRKAAFLIVASILTFAAISGLLFVRQGADNGQLALADDAFSMDLISLYSSLDPYFIYEAVLESDMTADELQFGLEVDENDAYQHELIEYLESVSEAYWQDTGEFTDPLN